MRTKVKAIIAVALSALSLNLVLPVPTFAALPTPNILLDPGNASSYSGTGTTVNSIGSASATGTMSNVTYSSTNGGAFVFTGSSSYISFPSAYQFGDNFTITAWCSNQEMVLQMDLAPQLLLLSPQAAGNISHLL